MHGLLAEIIFLHAGSTHIQTYVPISAGILVVLAVFAEVLFVLQEKEIFTRLVRTIITWFKSAGVVKDGGTDQALVSAMFLVVSLHKKLYPPRCLSKTRSINEYRRQTTGCNRIPFKGELKKTYWN